MALIDSTATDSPTPNPEFTAMVHATRAEFPNLKVSAWQLAGPGTATTAAPSPDSVHGAVSNEGSQVVAPTELLRRLGDWLAAADSVPVGAVEMKSMVRAHCSQNAAPSD